MPQPGMTSARGEDWLVRKVQDLERAVQQLAGANVFGLTGITPEDGGTSFDGYVNVNGPMTVNGDSNFKGNMTVSGTLNLPAGIIGNDALAAPVVISTSGVTQNNFGTTTGGAIYASATVPVPAGYSQADVLCLVAAGAANSTTSTDFLYISTIINGVSGGEIPVMAVGNNGYASGPANGIRTLTGLSGGSISVGAQLRSGAAWASSSGNIANMNAVVFFRR